VEKSSPIILATFAVFKRQPKVNSRPIGENSTNLVTMSVVLIYFVLRCNRKKGFEAENS
jgi:hypothetical protein